MCIWDLSIQIVIFFLVLFSFNVCSFMKYLQKFTYSTLIENIKYLKYLIQFVLHIIHKRNLIIEYNL